MDYESSPIIMNFRNETLRNNIHKIQYQLSAIEDSARSQSKLKYPILKQKLTSAADLRIYFSSQGPVIKSQS